MPNFVPQRMTPAQAVDLHLDLLHGLGSRMALEIFRSDILQHNVAANVSPVEVVEEMRRMVNTADTFMVTAEMQLMASEAAVDLEGMPLFARDLPSKNMLILLEDAGLTYFDPMLETGDADIWSKVRAIHVYEAGTIYDNASAAGVAVMFYGDTGVILDHFDMVDVVAEVGSLFPLDLTGWTFNVPWFSLSEEDSTRENALADPAATMHHVGQMRRMLLSLWLLMAEEIQPEYISDRAARRRWKRSSLNTPEDYSVGVTRLRRYAKREPRFHGDGESHLSHRFWVRGHWRRIHQGTTDERAVWVRPHIKGPEDAPMIDRFRVTSLNR